MILNNCSMQQFLEIFTEEFNCLVHLYWPKNAHYFEENLKLFRKNEPWLLTATPGHGIRQPECPSLNFFVPDKEFVRGYPNTVSARNLHRGLLIQRAAIEAWTDIPGYETANVRVIPHPNVLQNEHSSDDWKYDIGRYRRGAVHDISHAQFVRLATLRKDEARRIPIQRQDILAWWHLSSSSELVFTVGIESPLLQALIRR
ncbi:hypothetical protein [Massilia niabensis]|uniref:Uncharacterized protein n=1 Tax=Massilia niabensis TaxID=544910 RepID=A0ABW0L2Q6_9BURK